jgi:O-antigen ligase
MAFPLCWYSRQLTPFKILQWMFTIFAGFSVAAVVSSYSRGAAVSLAVVFLLLAMRSKHKILVAGMFALIAVGAVMVASESYLERLATIQAPAEEASAAGRMEYARAAIRMAKDYPLLGVGFGMSNQRWMMKYYSGVAAMAPAVGPGQVVHNTYLQMLTDSGVFGLLVYLALFVGTLIWLNRSAAFHRRMKSGLEGYPMALEGALAAFAAGSTFLSRVHFDQVYILLMTAASWQLYQRDWAAENQALLQPVAPGTPSQAALPPPRRPRVPPLPGVAVAPVTAMNRSVRANPQV